MRAIYLLLVIVLFSASCSKETFNESEDYSNVKEFLLNNKFSINTTENIGGSQVPITIYLSFNFDDFLANQKVGSWYGYGTEYQTDCYYDSAIGYGGLLVLDDELRIIWESSGGYKWEVKISSLAKSQRSAQLNYYKDVNLRDSYNLEKIDSDIYSSFLKSISDQCECNKIPSVCPANGL